MAAVVTACYSWCREARHENHRRRRPDSGSSVRDRRSRCGASSRSVPRSAWSASAFSVRSRRDHHRRRRYLIGGPVHISLPDVSGLLRPPVLLLILVPVHLPVLISVLVSVREPVCLRGAGGLCRGDRSRGLVLVLLRERADVLPLHLDLSGRLEAGRPYEPVVTDPKVGVDVAVRPAPIFAIGPRRHRLRPTASSRTSHGATASRKRTAWTRFAPFDQYVQRKSASKCFWHYWLTLPSKLVRFYAGALDWRGG